jgi:hydroxyacylglutathione hydrolase
MHHSLSILLGITNVYLLRGRWGWLLVDAGPRHWHRHLFRRMACWGLQPASIKLIVVTHAHFDHVGSLAAIRSRCGCPVAVHLAEADILRRGQAVVPPSLSLITRPAVALARRHKRLTRRLMAFPPVGPEIVVRGPLDLAPLGFDACIVPTPGHTAGSLSVLTGSHDAFVGDLAINYCRHLAWLLPPFGDDPGQIRRSWMDLIALGARRFLPAHGLPLPVQRLPLERSSRAG